MKGDVESAIRFARPLLWGLVALAAFYVAVSWPGWHRQAAAAAGLGARMACSCRYIEGRDMASCGADLAGMPWMALVRYADDPAARRVSASVPLIARRSARMKDGFGCLPEQH